MRRELEKIGSEERHIFYGTFERFGTKNGYKGPLKTVLLLDIEDENNRIVTNHLWFNMTKGFEKLNLKKGDRVKFKGRIKPYVKGYLGNRYDVFKPISLDYLIQYPTRISIVNKIE